MNIYDVSEKAGVSIATVSRVLNGNPNVSEQTRNTVLAVMEELGYTPNVFARGLGLNTMKTIGIMCTDSSDIYLANAVYYTEQELRSHDYNSILCCTGYDFENKKKSLELLLSKRVDAIIMIGSTILEQDSRDNAYIIAASRQIPIMLINGYLDEPNIFCTLCDDFQAVHDITDTLIRSGRRNPLYLYSNNSYSGTHKREGFLSALSRHALPIRDDYIQMCKKSISDARDTITRLYKDGLIIDSVIASDDTLAVGALKSALLNNLSVPEDISIVGYNNSVLATCPEPELTSIDNKVETLCISTVNNLMRIFDGCDVLQRTLIPADIVFRKTTNI